MSPTTRTHRSCHCSGRLCAFAASRAMSHEGCHPSRQSIPVAYIAIGHAAFAAYHATPKPVNASSLRRKNALETYDAAPTMTYAAPIVCNTAPPMEKAASSVVTRKCTNAIPRAVAVMPLRTQFKYAFSTARCRLCADARVTDALFGSAEADDDDDETGGEAEDPRGGGASSLCFPALLEPCHARARSARAARSAAREAVGGVKRDPATAETRAKPCVCGFACAIARVWMNAALAGPGTRGGGPAREIRATSRVATAASLRRDIAAPSARDAAGGSDDLVWIRNRCNNACPESDFRAQ